MCSVYVLTEYTAQNNVLSKVQLICTTYVHVLTEYIYCITDCFIQKYKWKRILSSLLYNNRSKINILIPILIAYVLIEYTEQQNVFSKVYKECLRLEKSRNLSILGGPPTYGIRPR